MGETVLGAETVACGHDVILDPAPPDAEVSDDLGRHREKSVPQQSLASPRGSRG
jgi:hypothetical protein